MAILTLTTFLTVDGVMQAPGGPAEDQSGGFRHGGWLVPHADADMMTIMLDIFSRADAFLLGRTTYDIFAAYWPQVSGEDDPIAHKLNTLPKHIASRIRNAFDWSGSSLVSDVAGEVAILKSHYAGEIQVHGSCGLAQTLIQLDLVDEYNLLTFPVLLGEGKRLFGAGTVPATLQLLRSATTGAGAVLNVYRRAGGIKTGTFV